MINYTNEQYFDVITWWDVVIQIVYGENYDIKLRFLMNSPVRWFDIQKT